MKILIDNKKAYFNFEVLDKYEAGMLLLGWEVKSIKTGKASISSAYIKVKDNEMWLVNSMVSANKSAGFSNSIADEKKDRKLLLHKYQLSKINSELKQKGITAVPLEVYQNNAGLIKVTVGLVKGRKKFDKRQKLKEQDIKRGIEQDRKRYNF